MSTAVVLIRKRKSSAAAAGAYGGAVLAVACAYAVMHVMRARPVFPLDDPYITLHSAQVLHLGYDKNFPEVSALFGVTSAPFLALLYLLLFVLPPLIALDMACWLGMLAYVLGLIRLARQSRLNVVEGVSIVLLGLIVSAVPFHLLNGLETSWALAAVTWTLVLSSGQRRMWKWGAVLAGATASLRPDLLPFSLLVAAALTYQSYKSEGSALSAMRNGAVFLLLAVLPMVPWALWYYTSIGVPYPLTGVAKHYSDPSLVWNTRIRWQGILCMACLISWGPVAAAILQVRRHPIAWSILLFFAVYLAELCAEFPAAPFWNWFRYPIVLTPMMIWAVSQGLTTSDRRKARTLLGVCLIYSLSVLPFWILTYERECRYFDRSLHDVVDWCRGSLPVNARVMVHDVGYISYASDYYLVDLIGLKTPDAIALNRRYVWPARGSNRAEEVSVLARKTRAEYLIVLRTWATMAALPDGLRALGWKVEPLRMDGEYQVYRISAPAG